MRERRRLLAPSHVRIRYLGAFLAAGGGWLLGQMWREAPLRERTVLLNAPQGESIAEHGSALAVVMHFVGSPSCMFSQSRTMHRALAAAEQSLRARVERAGGTFK